MLSPFELEKKCIDIFQRLDWEVINPRLDIAEWYDIVIRYNDVEGFVTVMSFENMKRKATLIEKILENEEIQTFFILTNGYAFDLYIGKEFFGCLSVPPTPEEIGLLLGGANNE